MTRHIDAVLHRSRAAAGVATLGAAAALLAACGATTTPGGSLSLPTLPAGLGATPSAATGPTSGQLGDTLVMTDVGEDIAHVTLLKIFDPATGADPNNTPPDGTRWVGFEGTIVITGARSGQDDVDVEVIGSDGQTYGANTAYSLHAFDGCTPTPAGDGLPPGTTQTFCSGVGLPPGVTVAKVGYSTEGVEGNAQAVLFWTVNEPSASTPTATPTASDAATPTATPTASDAATPTASPTSSPAAP